MNEPLQVLENLDLSSVEFVRDYVQLHFDGPCLTINAMFAVYVNGERSRKGELLFRNALCDRIGKVISKAFTIPNDEILLRFNDDSEIRISLKADDQVSPEAAVLRLPSGGIFTW